MFGLFKKAPPAAPALPPLRAQQLQPRIKNVQFAKELQEAGVPAEQMPALTPLCGELVVTYAFDLPDSFIMATPPLLRDAGISADAVAKVAAENLQGALLPVNFFGKGDGVRLVKCGGNLEATLLLVDRFWDFARNDMQAAGELIVAAPRRDCVAICDGADPAAVAALRERAEELFNEHDDAHRLSTQLMVRGDGGWSLFESH